MPVETNDWYPSTRQGERELYANIDAKIDSYKPKYAFLTTDYVEKIHVMCQTFIEVYDKVEQNRMKGKQMTTWSTKIFESKQKNEAVPPAPEFLAFTVPAGALVGSEQQCRKFAGLMKEQDEYEKGDGDDLGIEKVAGEPPNLGDAKPNIKEGIVNLDGSVSFAWKKTGFDLIEGQWRKAGTDMWQPGDKTNVSPIRIQPALTTPGVPEKFEFRFVYIIKNERVGQWSNIVTQTVG